MNIGRILSLFIICILVTITLTITVQAQEESDVPEWAEDLINSIPFLGPFLLGLGILICCVFFLIPLIIAILLCIWIYKDAEKRGKEGILWLILLILASIFIPIIGTIIVIVVWLLIRPPLK